jgi:hypothetical protein
VLAVDFSLNWAPLFGALSAVVLALLLVVGHSSLRRMALLIAGASLLALLIELAAVAGVVGGRFAGSGIDTYHVSLAVLPVARALTSVLALAAWVLLLYAAAQAGNRSRLVVLTLVLTLLPALQLALTTLQDPLVVWLGHWAGTNIRLWQLSVSALRDLSAVAVLVCALLIPADRAQPTAAFAALENR